MKRTLAILAASAVLLRPLEGMAWGGRLHNEINRAATQAVPDDMAAWRDYGRLLARYSIFPDVWKEADSAEGPRHYIDVERFRGVAVTNLPADYSKIQEMSTRRVMTADGILPWVIMDLDQRLTSAMASNRWIEVSELAAALGHYVADLHQPLHTTEHYDGQMTPMGGVHLRWEEQMPVYHWRPSLMKPDPAAYMPDPWNNLRQWIAQAHAQYRAIYVADKVAAAGSGDHYESAAYFNLLWNKTEDIFVSQVNAAATDLASLWYTAWVNAGKPAIPPPPGNLPEGSVWTVVPKQAQAAAWPYAAAFVVIAVTIIFLSVRGKKRV